MKKKKLFVLLLVAFHEHAFAQSYAYDQANRLTQANYPNGFTISYTYDKLGNRISASPNVSPAISSQPVAQTVCAGTTATFSVTASNVGTLQWRRNSITIPAANASTYTTPLLTPTDSGAIYEVVLTPSGSPAPTLTSNSATLHVVKHRWTGIVSSAWTNSSNWNSCGLPNSSSFVEIPAVAPNMPVISTSANVWKLNSWGIVEVQSGGALNVIGE